MNLSIRYKLLIYMTVNILLFAVLLFGSNTFFAEKYYVNSKKDTLIESSKKLSELVAGKASASDFNDETLLQEINILGKKISGNIYIGTADGMLYYPLENQHGGPPRLGLNNNPFYNHNNFFAIPPNDSFRLPGPPRNDVKSWEAYDKNSFFIVTEDPGFKMETLRYQTTLDNGLELLIWVPMAGISESASISNNFTAIIGLITILITGIWAFFISGRFTRPISQMNVITKKMSELDFTETLEIDRNDEIGQLSQSINQLSCNLDKAISELNIKNKQLELDIDHERQLDKMRREFVSNVSHELKTPIFLIQGYADGLKANVAADEKKRDFYCDVIMEETDKMDLLVKGLLDLSQIESGMFPVNKTIFNASVLINDIISKYEPVLKDKGIMLKVEMEEGLTVNADPIRIDQVIVNFMNNAIDHVDDKKAIKISAILNGNKVRVSVYNSGHHIPEESLDKVWSSFYKVDKARTRDIGGSGLGLSIVRAIQESHGNKYGVTNISDGVEFWFEVDLA